MSGLKTFLKESKLKKENVFYAPTKDFVDDKGKAVKWEFKSIKTDRYDSLRDACTHNQPVTGKPGQFTQKLDINMMNAKLIAECTVFPNLNDKELQDSYGVMSSHELIKEMVDNPGEYTDLIQFVYQINGFSDFADKVEEAKN